MNKLAEFYSEPEFPHFKSWLNLKRYLLKVQKELEERNGLPYCKNCSMDYQWLVEEIDRLIKE